MTRTPPPLRRPPTRSGRGCILGSVGSVRLLRRASSRRSRSYRIVGIAVVRVITAYPGPPRATLSSGRPIRMRMRPWCLPIMEQD
ncbi:pollen-specific leucine-rich repeat extensin-like protein 4 [Iris pallida]|uniref:Pollen-specific leucine-rich repeat extensin-like protein 4 n=1 Tax=Iris pallida TaxID=29817 RepID=A0AAX6HHZ3_IRIPA|nr:pollen-specific leucine-rich repeat extensin-like protein 4 [Iris pallida]